LGTLQSPEPLCRLDVHDRRRLAPIRVFVACSRFARHHDQIVVSPRPFPASWRRGVVHSGGHVRTSTPPTPRRGGWGCGRVNAFSVARRTRRARSSSSPIPSSLVTGQLPGPDRRVGRSWSLGVARASPASRDRYRSSGRYSSACPPHVAPTSSNHCVLLVSAGGRLLPFPPRKVRTVSVLVTKTKPQEPSRKQDCH
jgi:hypothetical protein